MEEACKRKTGILELLGEVIDGNSVKNAKTNPESFLHRSWNYLLTNADMLLSGVKDIKLADLKNALYI